MTIDLELIARRQRCEQSSLRIALPLLEQGYEPPFLTRYRRDELGQIPERALWEVVAALRNERQLDSRRDELRLKYSAANLDDDALLASIDQAQTPRQLDRIARRIRNESGHTTPSSRLAVRLLNPKADDPSDLSRLADLVVGTEHSTAAMEGLDSVLGQYLAADSRMVQAATSWMDRHVQLHVLEVHDPHEGRAEDGSDHDDAVVTEETQYTAPRSVKSTDTPAASTNVASASESEASITVSQSPDLESSAADTASAAPADSGALDTSSESPTVDAESPANEDAQTASGHETLSETSAEIATETSPAASAETAQDVSSSEPTDPASASGNAELESSVDSTEQPIAQPAEDLPSFVSEDGTPASSSNLGGGKKGKKSKDGAEKKPAEPAKKKISPRQRRRKWLVSVLQPLKGKSLSKAKLTAFQVVMLGRALRSQVAQCAFKYNAAELVNYLAKTAAGLNAGASNELSQVVIDNEASIREALEAAWWDDLIDRAARRLISVAADSLRRQMHRQPIEAKNVLVIDAVGPRTAAVVAVGPNDKVLHSEDVACQLSKSVRQQLVTRLGELVHQYHIDLIVVSNGPARRGCMVALSELLAQSEGSSLRWTLVERAGAEIYAGGPEGNRELRSLPRRFRAAVWLCQSVRSPARALAKVDVSKLRLGSYQRELAEKPLAGALEDVVTSGVSQVSVDVNAADRGWLASLPGVTDAVAEAIDRRRREGLFKSRSELLGLEAWPEIVAQRQAIGFLRVYDGSQALDATAIHPDDYPLAEKLMGRLEIPVPPTAPPGYQAPSFEAEEAKVAALEPEAPSVSFTELKVNVDPDRPFGPTDLADESVLADGQSDAVEASSATDAVSEVGSTEQTEMSSEPVAEASESNTSVEDTATAPADEAADDQNTTTSTPEPEAVETEPSAITETDGNTGAEAAGTAVEQVALEPYRHPLPDLTSISRCVKEWQVGENRVRQIVKALCEPFSDSTSDHFEPIATMSVVPKLTDLKPGDLVSGVVVGISGFGVFVELGPECSGLIHVSRLSEDYVEDLNEYLQIGDVITAWVIEIDTKRRRVSLSGVSPEKQAAMREQRAERGPRGQQAGNQGGGRPARSAAQPAQAATSQQGGKSGRPLGRGTGKPGGQTAGSGQQGGSGQGAGQGGGGQRERSSTGTGRDSRGGAGGGRQGGKPTGGQNAGGRGKPQGGRRDAGSRGPTTYTTVTRSDAPAAKLTEGMRAGSEPLRSFGDLMAFFKDTKESSPAPELPTDSAEPAQSKSSTENNIPAETTPKNVSESTNSPSPAPQDPSVSAESKSNQSQTAPAQDSSHNRTEMPETAEPERTS